MALGKNNDGTPFRRAPPVDEPTGLVIEGLCTSLLEHALDAYARGLKVYESLKSLNDIIGTQYGERVLFELLQNAHDAHLPEENGQVAIQLIIDGDNEGRLLVANKGRPFSASNLEAVRNIGTSDKEIGEGIGNKGLGFRSIEALTDDVHIFSAEIAGSGPEFGGYCFRFASTDEIVSRLQGLGADFNTASSVAASIPRYLVPVAVEKQSDEVRWFASEGFSTVVCLPLKSARAVELARQQIAAVLEATVPVQLFLERLVVLDVSVRSNGQATHRRLTRKVVPVEAHGMPSNFRVARVVLEAGNEFLVIRQTLPKDAVLLAVRESLAIAPPLKRWLKWKGDAVVSVAVSTGQAEIAEPRLFNFLPMDSHATSPMAGHIDAPFFADIDRRSIKPDLPLNKFLLEAAAETAAMAACAVVDKNLPLSEKVVVDLASWTGPHSQKIIAAFEAIGRPLSDACIWPVVLGGPMKWASFKTLFSWPGPRTKQLTPRRLASLGVADILSLAAGEARFQRVQRLAAVLFLPLEPSAEELCRWVEETAKDFKTKGWWSGPRWQEFYDEAVAVFAAAHIGLESLVGKQFFLGSEKKILIATATGLDDAPPVFYRGGEKRGKRRSLVPNPPTAILRKYRFLHQGVEVSEASLRAFEGAGLLRRYDPVEALSRLQNALGRNATEIQLQEALTWAFRVWSGSGGVATEEALRNAQLSVPCIGGWRSAHEALISGTWTALGQLLEQYLIEAAAHSPDCQVARDCLLVGFPGLPISGVDRREDWLRFLEIIGVNHGLKAMAADVPRSATPNQHWNRLLRIGDEKIGLDADWTRSTRNVSLSYSQTDYNLSGQVWRLPGQLEYSKLPPSAREALSDLLVAYLRNVGDRDFVFSLVHRRNFEKKDLPTPLQVFIREQPWLASVLGDKIVFAEPRNSWSTKGRLLPPRFVPRFGIDASTRAEMPPLLFDGRVGLRDWAQPASAPERLASLAASVTDLSAAERRDLRDQLRRAWQDVAEGQFELDPSLVLVVERAGSLELLSPSKESPPAIYITGDRDGFAARALADVGEAVIDVGEADGRVIRELLAAASAFVPRLVDSRDVQLIVDGIAFEPTSEDPRLVCGDLAWLSDAAVLAHEFLGDALELRTLSTAELDQRLKLIRIRRCNRVEMTIAGRAIKTGGNSRVHAVLHGHLPTVLMLGNDVIDVGMLQEAAPALTKLVGSRRNTLEIMLSRLQRAGFTGSAPGPSEEMLATAIQRDVGVIRDHFAAARGGAESHVAVVLPAVAYLKDRDAASRLQGRLDHAGSAFQLREWLANEFGEDVADKLISATTDTVDQKTIRKRLGFDLAAYGRILAELGYPPLNDPADFHRIFGVFVGQVAPTLLDRLRRKFFSVWRDGGDLTEYVGLRTLQFIEFDPAWLLEREEIDMDFVASRASEMVDERIGGDDLSISLQPLDRITAENRKLLISRYARTTSLIRAWCRKHEISRPQPTESADPQLLVRTLDLAGLLDFVTIKAADLPAFLSRVGAWPAEMPLSDRLSDLDLVEADLQHDEREEQESRRSAEVERRTIHFVGGALDTGSDDFAFKFEQLAEEAIAGDENGWLKRARPPRLSVQEQKEDDRHRTGSGSAKNGKEWRNQPPEAVRKAMGMASEWLAREYLRQRYPAEMSDDCWVSSNREAFCTGASGDDSLGFDFCVKTAQHEYQFEVKSAMDAGGEFELTARELEVASRAGRDRKLRYRILYVPYVFDPTRWTVLTLPNPIGQETRKNYRVVRSGSVRYRFELR